MCPSVSGECAGGEVGQILAGVSDHGRLRLDFGEWLRNHRGYGKDQKAGWAPHPDGFGQEQFVMVTWLSVGQSDQVPASSLALVSYWREQT